MDFRFSEEQELFRRTVSQFASKEITPLVEELELATLMTYKAGWMDDQGMRCNKEASIAKLYASQMVNRVAYKALQVFGGCGYMTEYPLERYFWDARVFEIFEGTSEIQRVIISRELGL